MKQAFNNSGGAAAPDAPNEIGSPLEGEPIDKFQAADEIMASAVRLRDWIAENPDAQGDILSHLSTALYVAQRHGNGFHPEAWDGSAQTRSLLGRNMARLYRDVRGIIADQEEANHDNVG